MHELSKTFLEKCYFFFPKNTVIKPTKMATEPPNEYSLTIPRKVCGKIIK